MKFNLNKIEQDKINKLIDTFLYNNEIADYLNNEIINEIDPDNEIEELKIKELNPNDYINDLYYKNIKIKEVNENNYKIKYQEYKPNQCFLYDDIKVNEDDFYLVNNHVGYFSNSFKYLTIEKDNVIWMSLIPHEMNTMKSVKNKLSKHIYVLGLGLAYFPYINASKVDKITIIEKDKNIISLFKKYLFPYFDNKDKYEIIEDDAYQYIKNISRDDFLFIDLYHDTKDGLKIYIDLLKLLKDHHNYSFWIEESLIQAYRNLLITLINEELYHHDEVNYSKAKTFEDKLINELHSKLKDYQVSSYKDIQNLLSKDNIKKLITY